MAERDSQDVRRTLMAMYGATVDVAHPKSCLPPHLPPVPEGGRLIVIPDTLARAGASNLNAANFLENNGSTGFFRAIGDLIQCGPTQTNVNDFRVILVDP